MLRRDKSERSWQSSLAAFPLLLGLTLLPTASGQMTVDTVRIKVLNGRNGKPLKRAVATVEVYPQAKYETPLSVTADLGGSFSLLVQHAGELSTRIDAHPACERRSKADATQTPTRFPVAAIMSAGIVSSDTCGRQRMVPQPGTLILYVGSVPWWQRVF